MNEEDKLAPEPQESPDPPESPKTPEEEHPSPPPRRRSVFVYLAVLFGTAFLLLLFAYLMQQRDSDEITGYLSQLQESMGSIQSIDQLTEENRKLREEKEALEREAAGLQEELDTSKILSESDIQMWRGRYEATQDILSAFIQVDSLRKLYEQGDLEGAKALLDKVKESESQAGADEVEYHLGIYMGKFVGNEDILKYDPLKEWRELKQAVQDALAEEEKAE